MKKFDWIFLLARDGRLSYSDKYILTVTALRSVNPRGLTFCIRQATIAENCAASPRTVRRALAAGRRHGYIELVSNRKRGRGNRGADEYRLALPPDKIEARVAAISDSEYRPPAPEIAATGARNSGQTRTPDQPELPPPLGLIEVSRRSAADAAPRQNSPQKPNRFCSDHMPYGTDDNCGKCARQKERLTVWEADRPNRERSLLEARRRCNICGGHLFVLGADLTPIEPPKWCPVCKPAQANIG